MRASVVYLCDWLPPDFGAVGQYALRAARELARQGREVLLVGLSTAGDSEVEERVGPTPITGAHPGTGPPSASSEPGRWAPVWGSPSPAPAGPSRPSPAAIPAAASASSV